eukprot:551517-Hanusia_phi.AAC.3
MLSASRSTPARFRCKSSRGCISLCWQNFIASGQIASMKRRTSDGRPCAAVLVWNASTLKRNNRPVEEVGARWNQPMGVLDEDVLGRMEK